MTSTCTPFIRKQMVSVLRYGLMLWGFLASDNVSAQVSLNASSGTASGSYATLSDAFAAINAGTHKGAITISITGNTTEPATPIPLYGSGTSSAASSSFTSVLIKPAGGSDRTINSAASPSANRGIVELAGADNVTIDGDDPTAPGTRNLIISSVISTSTIANIRLSSNSNTGTDGANNVTIRNCQIIGARNSSTATTVTYGIVMCNFSTTTLTTGAYSSLNTVIENNEIRRAYRGIYANGSSSAYPNTGLRIRNNIIGNASAADNIGQYGIYLSYTAANTSSSTQAIIEGNDIQCGDFTTGFSTSVGAVYLSSYNYGMIIRRNNIHDVAQSASSGWGAYGIYISSSSSNDISIENNFIRDITANSYSATLSFPSSFQNYGIYLASIGTNFKITHNTVLLNKANPTTSGVSNPLSACLAFASSTAIAQLYNNIFINRQGAASNEAVAVYTYATTNLPSGATNNNDLYASGSGKIGYYNGAIVSTLVNWQLATGLDANSVSEDVTFSSASDLHIAAGTNTLCESGGVSAAMSGVVLDIDSTTRPGPSTYGFGTAPDIGADEFNGRAVYTCTTPAPGATIASATAICAGKSVSLSLTTATAGTGVSYQWQSSPDGIMPYTDISGAISPVYTTTPSAITYYRCKVRCKAGPDSTYSTPVQVGFTNNILSTTPGTRCGTGTVPLSATASSGATLKWYNVATGGAALGSGTSFTTPVLSATTTFYAAAETYSTGTVPIGSGVTTVNSSTGITPLSLLYTSAHTQYLVLASDLTAAGIGAGNLNSLSFEVTTKSSSKAYNGYTIKLAHTTASSLTGMLAPAFSTVWGPVSYNSVLGTNNFIFSSAFNWDGTSNLLVDVCFDNVTPAAGYSSNDAVTFISKPFTATYGMYTDPTNLCGLTTGGSSTSSSGLPLFSINGTLVCSGPRVPVLATVNTAPAFSISGTQTVCNNNAAALSVTSTLSNYTSYTWSPTAGLYTDAACSIPYTAGTSSSAVYAKNSAASAYVYTASAYNSGTLCAAVANDTVTNLPASVSVIAAPANLCGSGTATFSMIPSAGYGAATFAWNSSTDNSTFTPVSGATGNTYTTPAITSSAYYRVTVKNSAGSVCLNSTSDTALVFNPNITSTTGASRCGPGSVTLSATGVDGTVYWFSGASGGSSIATGNSFTTPSLSSTTTYYTEVRATNDDSATIGTAGASQTGNGLTPFSNYYEGAHTQYLYLAADLTAAGLTAGTIQGLSFNVTSKLSTFDYQGYTVKMAGVSAANLSTGLLSPVFTTVYGPVAQVVNTGQVKMNFSNGFVWDGSSNILVDVCFANDPGATGTFWSANDAVAATTKSYTAVYGYYGDNSSPCGATLPSSTSSNMLPDIRFFKNGCVSGTRQPVVATINPLPTPGISPAPGPIEICDGYTTTLTGTGGGTYQWKNASGNISGATAAAFTTGVAGTYRVVITNSFGCKDSTAFVTVNVNPSPTVSIAPSGTTTICADSLQVFTAATTGAGLSYRWFRNDTAIAGAIANAYTANTAGRYTLRVYLGSCSDTSNESVLNVNPLPASSFLKTGLTGAICIDSTLELTALSVPSGYKYQWLLDGKEIPGATSQVYKAAKGGYYKVRITDNNNCRRVSDSMMIINTPMGIPNLSPTNAYFCEGTEMILYANAGKYAASYVWTKDGLPVTDTTPTLTVGKTGWYDVTATDVFGCKATSGKVRVDVLPAPAKPVINRSGISLSTNISYKTYQWYRNGKLISGATGRYYTAAFDGRYYVVVTNAYECAATSDEINYTVTGVAQVEKREDIRLYPNPSNGTVHIESPVPVQVVVKDIQGRQVAQLKDATAIDLSDYADGVYLFFISDNEGNFLRSEKIVKSSGL
ncbi:T9SS type A sorting domain-containing protein [Rurimicrobium arvi]